MLKYFICFLLFPLSVFAASGTGTASVEFTAPLSVVNSQNIDFGTIAVDPSSGPQIVSMQSSLVCPATYVCSGSSVHGKITVTGAPNATFNFDMTGSVAILSDGLGNTLIFDPSLTPSSGVDTYSYSLDGTGEFYKWIYGTLSFSGNEPAGIYNTTNAGGSGYTITVNY